MNQNTRPVTVVGGANVDIGGFSQGPLIPGDSNPGQVRMSLGGVGRNIAHNLALLGLPVQLLTALGDDLHSRHVLASCARLGMDTSAIRQVPGAATSTYVYLADQRGEMALAVSDMAVCRQITPEYLAGHRQALESCQAVVADANIPAASLEYLAKHTPAPLFVDPVSTTKAEKLRGILPWIHTLKPNRLEAELLCGFPVRTPAQVEQGAAHLLGQGVQQVFISLGAQGVYAADASRGRFFPCLPGDPVNTTGCGDAFTAALVWAWSRGLSLEDMALAGLAAGAIAAETTETIHPGMCSQALLARMHPDENPHLQERNLL